MPMRALDTGGGMGASTKVGLGGSAVVALAIVISSHATSLGTSTAFIRVTMGGYSLMCRRSGLPLPLTLV
jgi:hypothetical protein